MSGGAAVVVFSGGCSAAATGCTAATQHAEPEPQTTSRHTPPFAEHLWAQQVSTCNPNDKNSVIRHDTRPPSSGTTALKRTDHTHTHTYKHLPSTSAHPAAPPPTCRRSASGSQLPRMPPNQGGRPDALTFESLHSDALWSAFPDARPVPHSGPAR